MSTSTMAGQGSWYSAITPNQWKTMIASNLGWMFDGYETFALIICAGAAMHQLLAPSEFSHIPAYVGTVIAITLLGWGLGGIVGGIVADYIGRRRTMILAILAYSLTTGLSAIAWDWVSFALLRFLVGIAIGSEWSTGTSMTAEAWPPSARGRGAALMHCGLGVGFFLASFAWLYVSGYGENAWRIMFVIGILPALFTLWLRTGVNESQLWEQTNEKRKVAQDKRKSGASMGAEDQNLTRFTFADLFAEREIRNRTIVLFLMSLTTTVAWWGIATWVAPFTGRIALAQHLPQHTWEAYAGMAYNGAAILGYIGLGFAADFFGRKPVLMVFYVGALIMTPVFYLWTTNLHLLVLLAALNGFFTLGQYSWMSVWLPEQFPTRMRATGMAFVFNSPRLIACLGPLFAGVLIAQFGGFGNMAAVFSLIYILGFVLVPFLPETKGRPLPA